MKSKLLGIALFIVTVGAVVYYPQPMSYSSWILPAA
jgi:hypothetical protein